MVSGMIKKEKSSMICYFIDNTLTTSNESQGFPLSRSIPFIGIFALIVQRNGAVNPHKR